MHAGGAELHFALPFAVGLRPVLVELEDVVPAPAVAEMPLGDVFFDYDMSTLSADARAILQRNADWLKRWTSTRVTVEGNADSRGSAEYNLALGDRRAKAVRDYLLSLGIAADRLLAWNAVQALGGCVPVRYQAFEVDRDDRGVHVIEQLGLELRLAERPVERGA